MSAEIIQFVPKPNPNRDGLARIHGVPANVARSDVEIVGDPINLPTRPGMDELIANSAVEISGDFVGIPYGGAGIDGMKFDTPEDCA